MRSNFIADLCETRDNNFNLIRLIAALVVVISHAYPVSIGQQDPVYALAGQASGTLAVQVFFAISGFLIARSYLRSSSIRTYVISRALRIFPALAVVLALSVLVLGPIFTSLPVAQYFSQPETYSYLLRNLLLFDLQHNLPGVFDTNSHHQSVNVSLWTLAYEVALYGVVVLLGLAGILTRKLWMALSLALVTAGCAFAISDAGNDLLPRPLWFMAQLAFPFFLGCAAYVFRAHVPLSLPLALGLCALTVLTHGAALFWLVLVATLSYLALYLSLVPKGPVLAFNKLGDYSYGVYIFGYPIQQIMIAMLGPMTPWENIAYAAPATLICAVASWHLIEAPALRLKSLARLRAPLHTATSP